MYTCFSLPGLGRVQISRPFLTKSFEMLGFPDSSGRIMRQNFLFQVVLVKLDLRDSWRLLATNQH